MQFKTNKKEDATERVINYIKLSIKNGTFPPGVRLPSERKLSEMLGVSRPNIRKAIQKLELYGIVKTYPQSGTVISAFTKEQFDNMCNEMLKTYKYDFLSLVHVRLLLETEACALAAQNRTNEDLRNIELALLDLENAPDETSRVKLDFEFHQAIVHSSHNMVLKALLQIITPDIIKYYLRFRRCATPKRIVENEHREFVQKIKDQDVDGVKDLLHRHLSSQIEFAQNTKTHQAPKFQFRGL